MAQITVKVPARVWKDKRGNWIMYSKKYDICGYGRTKNRANKMFEFVVLEVLEYDKFIYKTKKNDKTNNSGGSQAQSKSHKG